MNSQLAHIETGDTDTTGPFLPPVEKPKSLLMKVAYYFMKKQFGKVMTPITVHSARLPNAFGLFYTKVSRLDGKLKLSEETALLIRQQVARINVCLFCMDSTRWAVIHKSMNVAKFDALDEYRTSPLFSDAERAALDYATELTKNKRGDPELFANMKKYYSDRELCEMIWLIASEHIYNMTNVGLNIHSDMLCEIRKPK